MKQLNFKSIILQFLSIVLLVAICIIWHQGKQLKSAELAYQNVVSVSMDSLHKYKVADSLNAIYTSDVELSLKQYKQLRVEDAKLIKQLKADKLSSAVKPTIVTKWKVDTQIKDSFIYNTEYIDTLKYISYRDKWNSVEGILSSDSAKLNIQSKNELLITKSYIRKRFLGIKLNPRIFGYRNLQLDVVSKNPSCQITDIEYITIKP